MMDENLDWTMAKAHFDSVLDDYKELVGGPSVNVALTFAITLAIAITFDPLLKRYNSGERTQELFAEMMAVS